MVNKVDSYRFLDVITRRLVRAWIKLESHRLIPWTPLAKPLRDCTVALLSTAGIALKTDRPFDQEGERRNPWWGDPSYRVIPATVCTQDIRIFHMHINASYAGQDMNCLLPVERLRELAGAGLIRNAAPSHYSIMGYQLDPRELLENSIPEIIMRLRSEQVDLLVLLPA
jgi:D-proline reductase (dithiol) PrdB